jgi:hypothetical protein
VPPLCADPADAWLDKCREAGASELGTITEEPRLEHEPDPVQPHGDAKEEESSCSAVDLSRSNFVQPRRAWYLAPVQPLQARATPSSEADGERNVSRGIRRHGSRCCCRGDVRWQHGHGLAISVEVSDLRKPALVEGRWLNQAAAAHPQRFTVHLLCGTHAVVAKRKSGCSLCRHSRQQNTRIFAGAAQPQTCRAVALASVARASSTW